MKLPRNELDLAAKINVWITNSAMNNKGSIDQPTKKLKSTEILGKTANLLDLLKMTC
jgi:hypothetical protein